MDRNRGTDFSFLKVSDTRASEKEVSAFSKIIQDTYEKSMEQRFRETGGNSFYQVENPVTYTGKAISYAAFEGKELDTGKYRIFEKEGTLWIHDKLADSKFRCRFHSVGAKGMTVQVDEESGQKFLFDDYGSGIFMFQMVLSKGVSGTYKVL